MTISWAQPLRQDYAGSDVVTCPDGHEFPAFEAKLTEDHPVSDHGPQECTATCPECGVELEDQ